MRKLLMTALAVVFGILIVPQKAQPGAYSVEPCLQSKLCSGLVEHFALNEVSDSPRFGAFGSVLHEVGTTNLGTGTGPTGSGTAASFDGTANSFLWSSTFVPNMSSGWSVSFRFKATALPASGAYMNFVSRHANANNGSAVTLFNNAGTTHVRIYTWNKESTVFITKDSTASISAGAWYYVAAGVGDQDDIPGGTVEWVSVNGAAKDVSGLLNYIPKAGLSHFRVGQQPSAGKAATGGDTFNGLLSGLDIYGRNIGPSDITLLYNGGATTPLTYPYVTE